MMFIATFCVLIVTAFSMLHKTSKSTFCPKNVNFKRLQTQYLIVYCIASFADWLQGPYVYKLYSDYGYTETEIALLYIAGFASSSIFGALVGLLADLYGRKTMSAWYGIIYSLCCLSKMSTNFYILFFGRICGGISTSILCTTFEAWYINEHTNHYNLPVEWLNLTFSKATFYNGFLAILAGFVSQISAEVLKLGSASPFFIAVPFLIISTLLIMTSWTEHARPNVSSKIGLFLPLKLMIFEKPKLLLIGLFQSLYEATMYTFIFSWTPIISSLEPPIGLVFSCFMVAFMIGSKLNALMITKKVPVEGILMFTSLLSLISLSVVLVLIYMMKTIMESGDIESTTETFLTQLCFYCFITYEVCVGMYVPAIGYIKGKIVPEEYRASVTNWFRVPMNIFTCFSLTLNQFCEQDILTFPPSLNTFRQFSYVLLLCSVFLIISLTIILIYMKYYATVTDMDQNQKVTEIIKVPIESEEHVVSKKDNVMPIDK